MFMMKHCIQLWLFYEGLRYFFWEYLLRNPELLQDGLFFESHPSSLYSSKKEMLAMQPTHL